MEINFIEYKSREYCTYIGCKKTHCKSCEAYKFHNYLKDHNYQIVKKDMEIITRNNFKCLEKRFDYSFINKIFVNNRTKQILTQPPYVPSENIVINETDGYVQVIGICDGREIRMNYIKAKDEWHLISSKEII